MLIALLVFLGVNVMVVAVLLGVVLSRKRWVKRRPGSFRGVIRVSSGEIDGLRPKWSRGQGHWVRDVLVWTKAPFLFRNELVATDGLEEQRPAERDEVKRLGDHPVVTRIRTASGSVEIATHDHDCELALSPYRRFADPAMTSGQPPTIAQPAS